MEPLTNGAASAAERSAAESSAATSVNGSANGNGFSRNGYAHQGSPDLELRVRHAIEHVKPYLMVDGGSVELVRIDYDAQVVEVCMMGACKTCSMAIMTLRAGIERAILHEAPEIRRVEAVSNRELEYAFECSHPSIIDLLV